MTRGKLVERIEDLVLPVLGDMDCELVDLEFHQEGGRWLLRVFADKPGGITLDDCARLSREIGDILDVKDLIEHEYLLEVSSPGLDRPLKKEKDFAWAVGRLVRVKTHAPLQGRQRFIGRLERFDGGSLYINIDGHEFTVPYLEVKKANVIYEF